MITIAQLYEATDGGLDIICRYYPEARTVAGTKNKFKLRTNERTASATIRLKDGGKYGRVWKVTDFGDEGRELSPIDICMKEEGLKRINEAILFLAGILGIADDRISQQQNRCTWEERPATADEKDGTLQFKLLDEIPEAHLKILGPKVCRKHVEALNWHEAEWIGWVKDRMVKVRRSNDHYPIFLRECNVDEMRRETASPDKSVLPSAKGRFYKVYEPLNFDKKFRFSYSTADDSRGMVKKPAHYINGLFELRKRWVDFNEAKRRDYTGDADASDYKERKLDEVVICSGERDALCCLSMGYQPVWFNSETYTMTEEDYKLLSRYAGTVYNIPDLDATGIRKGSQLALRHLDVATVWLPQTIGKYNDNRGRPRKDLRDWMEIYDRQADFDELINVAMPARFWFERFGKDGKVTYEIDTECLFYFLKLQGFATYKDPFSDEVLFVHITGNEVRRVTAREIRLFVVQWARDNNLPRAARNTIINTPRVSDATLDNLPMREIDFSSFTDKEQYFFFPGQTVRVTAEEVEDLGNSVETGRFVWADKIIPHKFRKLERPFTITKGMAGDGKVAYDIDTGERIASSMMGYLMNASRLYWRKELEERFEDFSPEAAAYHATHKFTLNGEGLTEEEKKEQRLSFLNKVFTVGYMLHRYKAPSRAWAPFVMDNKIGETDQCNGRSGKSLVFTLLAKIGLRKVTKSGRNIKAFDNDFAFDQVRKDTDFVLIDDCAPGLQISRFYDLITGDFTVNPKNQRLFTIPFEDSPKLTFTTNYVPSDFDASSEARMLYMVFSDYYHEQAESNDYIESRSVRDDFGKDLMGQQYTEDEWNADLNFLLECCRFYLQVLADGGRKIQPPLGNIITRKFKADMGDAFEDWATTYFGKESGRIDSFVNRREALEDFTLFSNQKRVTMQRFTRSLKGFVALCPYIYELNPLAFCNSQGRIVRKDPEGKSAEYIYIRSMADFEQRGELTTEDADLINNTSYT